MSMNCKFCFAELEDGATVCPACGKDLTEETPAEEIPEEIPQQVDDGASEEASEEDSEPENSEESTEEEIPEETPQEQDVPAPEATLEIPQSIATPVPEPTQEPTEEPTEPDTGEGDGAEGEGDSVGDASDSLIKDRPTREELIKFVPFMLFLRILYKYSNNRKLSVVVSMLIVMVFFALLHAMDFRSLFSVLVLQGLGSIFEFIGYIKTKNIMVSYITHLCTDVFIFALIMMGVA